MAFWPMRVVGAIDGVVDEDGGEFLPPHGGVNDLRRADGGQIPVPLIGENRLGGVGPFHGGGHRRGPAMGGLDGVEGEVVPGEDGAAHGADTDGGAQGVHLLQHLADELMYDAVGAAGAVVELRVLEALGLPVNRRHVT